MAYDELINVRRFQVYSSSVYALGQIVIIAISLAGTDGRLIYTLDDPYIHLSVAESILQGEYGINQGEPASPSSSIIYPFLLALTSLLGLGEFGPLVYALPFTFLSVWLLSGVIWKIVGSNFNFGRALAFALLGPALVLSINAVALPMTGMEHSIHVFGSILALVGLTMVVEGDDRGLAAAIIGAIICATIRFEGLALTIAVLGALFVLGYRLYAGVTFFGIAILLSLYAGIMISLGLPPLPSSVLTKSYIATQATDQNIAGLAKGIITNTYHSLDNRWGVLLSLSALALMVATFAFNETARRRRLVFVVASIAIVAHILAGRYGWFGRYEVYVVAIMILGISAIPFFDRLPQSSMSAIAIPAAVLIVGAPYVSNIAKAPAASANIYQQQYQMHRFAREFFPDRVAVNDLGWVAYRNPNYVLDLWGLGSEVARRLSQNNHWTPELLREITSHYEVSYAMIYDSWFREVPDEWCHMGNLVTSKVTSASGTVSFYLIRTGEYDRMREALHAFASDLPSGARFDLLECEPSS